MTNCIIIERDRSTAESLNNLILSDFSNELDIEGIAFNAVEGINLVKCKYPGIVFLDLDMPDQTGFYLFSIFHKLNIEIVLTSSDQTKLMVGSKLLNIPFLVKPYTKEGIRAIVNNIKNRHNIPNLSTSNNYFASDLMGVSVCEKVALPTSDGFQVFRFNEILYCQAAESYSYVHALSGKPLLITKTLKSIEEMLPSTIFFRIHKSILLNINYVKSFSKKDGFIVTLENMQQFEIATRRQEDFVRLFQKKVWNEQQAKEKISFTGETLN